MKFGWGDYSQYMEKKKSCSKPPTSHGRLCELPVDHFQLNLRSLGHRAQWKFSVLATFQMDPTQFMAWGHVHHQIFAQTTLLGSHGIETSEPNGRCPIKDSPNSRLCIKSRFQAWPFQNNIKPKKALVPV